MIRRPARYLGIDPAKPKFGQIEFLDKDIDHANRIVLADPVCHAFRKQRALPAIRPLNEALHLILPQIARESYPENQIQRCVFTQPGPEADIRLLAGALSSIRLVPFGITFRFDYLEMRAHTAMPISRGRIILMRSEERRVRKECRSRWSPYH